MLAQIAEHGGRWQPLHPHRTSTWSLGASAVSGALPPAPDVHGQPPYVSYVLHDTNREHSFKSIHYIPCLLLHNITHNCELISSMKRFLLHQICDTGKIYFDYCFCGVDYIKQAVKGDDHNKISNTYVANKPQTQTLRVVPISVSAV